MILLANFDGSVFITHYNETLLVCNMNFGDEDEAIAFYENQRGKIKNYSAKDILSISDFSYLEKLNSYNNFIDYLQKDFDINKNDVNYSNEFIIGDLLYLAQISISVGINVSKDNIQEMFKLNQKELNELVKLVKEIYKEWTKWRK